MPELPLSSTNGLASQTPPTAKSLTFEDLLATIEAAEKRITDMNDKLVESLLTSGFRVIINDAMPDGMVAVLPGNFRGSLKRATEKLRAGDRQFGFLYNLNLS